MIKKSGSVPKCILCTANKSYVLE